VFDALPFCSRDDPQAAIANVQPAAASANDRRLFGTFLGLVPCLPWDAVRLSSGSLVLVPDNR
jgi:hypothetical protein